MDYVLLLKIDSLPQEIGSILQGAQSMSERSHLSETVYVYPIKMSWLPTKIGSIILSSQTIFERL